MLQLKEAGLISTNIEGILFGFGIFMYIVTYWILSGHGKQSRKRSDSVLIVVTTILLLLTSGEMVVNIIHIARGFLNIEPTQAEAYFTDVSEPTFVIKTCLYGAQTLVFDGVVIYRAWIVWQKDFRIVIVPIVGWFGLLSSVLGTAIALSKPSESTTNDVFATRSGRWITSVYSTTLGTNLSATGLLAYRIWTVNRRATQWRTRDHLSPILRVVIESGAIYSVSIVVALILFVTQSPGVYVILDMLSPIISIVYNMLIIRIAIVSQSNILQSNGDTTHDPSAGIPIEAQDRREYPSFHLGWLMNTRDYEMKGVAVEVTQYQETDGTAATDSKPSVQQDQVV